MRLAADPADPAYNQVAKGCKIFVNGVEMRYVLSADEEAGEVERVKLDAAGNVLIDAYGSVRSETIRGTIRIDLAACEFPAWMIGFDTWMRQRTDRAHADFMRRTNALSELRPKYASGGVVAGVALVGEAGPGHVGRNQRSAPCAN